MEQIRRALLSVSDKAGLVPLARSLAAAGVEIISTGGTAKALREAGLIVTELSAYTGFPEMLDGRVKTLHPKVHGGLLYLRGNASHEAAARAHGIDPINLVVVILYPFEQTVARPNVSLQEAIENIDIGGPSMLRSAAKNHESVTVVVDPADYEVVGEQIRLTGRTTLELRRRLAAKAFARTAAYDAAIATHLGQAFGTAPPATLPVSLRVEAPLVQALRYGENPHQKAALYGGFHDYFQQLHGKELSYNNILDLTAAASLTAEFAADPPTLAILKHTNPCGLGQGASLREAWDKALATDRQAPFGGIIAVNCALDSACAEAIAEIFSEVIVAPDFTAAALGVLQKKKNLRLLRTLEIAAHSAAVGCAQCGRGLVLVAGTGFEGHDGGELEDRDAPAANGGGVESHVVRLARGEAREVQRHRVCRRGSDAGRRGGSDEPGGCEPDRSLESGRGGPFAQGQRGLQRRILPVSGWFDHGGGGGRHGGDSAGWLSARC